jgi:hypothetical protein
MPMRRQQLSRAAPRGGPLLGTLRQGLRTASMVACSNGESGHSVQLHQSAALRGRLGLAQPLSADQPTATTLDPEQGLSSHSNSDTKDHHRQKLPACQTLPVAPGCHLWQPLPLLQCLHGLG